MLLLDLGMGKIGEFLAGIKVLEEVDSKYNGKLTVVKSLGYGVYIKAGGLTQSGGIVTGIWKRVLRKVSKGSIVFWNPKVLILGLGGGGIVEVVNEYWPEADITAVDIDPAIVKLGKKYLNLENYKIKTVITDAEEVLVKNRVKFKDHFDLVLIDLYVGDEFPKKFQIKEYLQLVRKVLKNGGVAVFNRLYYGEKRKESVKFGSLLETVFSKVDWVYPEANIMFICHK